MGDFELIKQQDQSDCGVACLAMILAAFQSRIPLYKLRQISGTDKQGTSALGLIKAMEEYSIDCLPIQADNQVWNDEEMSYPAIAHIINEEQMMHYVVVYGVNNDFLLIADPAEGKKKCHIDEFSKKWTGVLLIPNPSNQYEPVKEDKRRLTQFLPLIAKNKSFLFTIILFSLITMAITILSSFYFQLLIDYLIPSQNYHWLNVISLTLVIAYLFLSLFSYFRDRLIIRYGQKLNTTIVFKYYRHVLKLPLNFFSSRHSGDIISRFLDANKIVNALGTASLSLILDVGIVVAVGAALFFQSPILFLITLISLPFYALVILLFVKKHDEASEKEMVASSQLNSSIMDSLEGIETLKSLNASSLAMLQLEKKFNHLIKKSFTSNHLEVSQKNLKNAITLISQAVTLCLGAHLVMNGAISLGQLMTYNILIMYFTEPLQSILNLQVTLQQAHVANDRMSEILEIESEFNHEQSSISLPNAKMDIQVKNLSFSYNYQGESINDVSFKIPYGSKTTIVGPSGSGKSTLAKLLVNFYKPLEGDIRIGKYSLRQINKKSLREYITYLPQHTYLIRDSLYQNLIFGLKEEVDEEWIWQILDVVGLSPFVKNHPLELEMAIEEDGSNLSGGQKQRVALARALLRDSDIYILDEATSAVDPLLERQINEYLLSLDKTIIFITHDINSLKTCDQILVMDGGEIIDHGTHDELLNISKLYQRMFKNINY